MKLLCYIIINIDIRNVSLSANLNKTSLSWSTEISKVKKINES